MTGGDFSFPSLKKALLVLGKAVDEGVSHQIWNMREANKERKGILLSVLTM